MKRTLIFFEILCMIFFLLFSSADKRTQFLTSLAGPGCFSTTHGYILAHIVPEVNIRSFFW